MNKARKKRYRRGTLKRLAQESLVLSFTRRLSSRFVRFFESGFASPLLSSAKSVDEFVNDKVTGPIYKKTGIRKNFSMPTRNAVASVISRSSVMKKFGDLRTAFLNASMRSVGVFLITFGIYAAAIFLLKSYVSLNLGSEPSIDDLSFSAITALVGMILVAFGDKSILNTVGNGRIVGQLLLKCLGVNDSSIDRYASATPVTTVGISFLLGSIAGISTLFVPLSSVFLFILTFFVCVAILHIPEFGILLAASTFSYVNIDAVAFVVFVTFASFLIKCVRLKRNFGFGTADAVVLLLFVTIFVSSAVSNGSVSHEELCVLCFTSVYFLAKNLLCSKKLVYQTLNALCIGLSVGMALYILGDFAALITHDDLRAAAVWLTRYTLEAEMLTMAVSLVLPFALSSFTTVDKRRPKRLFIMLAIVCAVLVDNTMFYVLLLSAVFVFVSTTYRAPVGAALGAAVILPPVAILASDYTTASTFGFGARTVYDTTSMSVVEHKFTNFWSGINAFGGLIATLLFIVAILLILQRIFSAVLGNNGNTDSRISGAVGASAIITVVSSFVFNPFYDLRIFAVMWFVFGFCGAMSKMASLPKYSE